MFPKIVAGAILIIMATTWGAISYKLGVMVSVSDNFLWLAGLLGSVVFGDSIASVLLQRLTGGKK